MDSFVRAAVYYLRPSLQIIAKLSSVIPLWMTAVMIDKHALGIPLLEGSLWHSPRIPPRLSIGANRGGGGASGPGSVRRPAAGDGGSSAHEEGLPGEAAPFGAGSLVRSVEEVTTPVAQPSEGAFFPSESLISGASSSSSALSLYQRFEVFDPFNFTSGPLDSGFLSTVLLLPLLIGYLAALKAGRRHSSSKSQPTEASQKHSKHGVGTQTPEVFLLQYLVQDVDLSTFGGLTLEELVAYSISPISENDMEGRMSVSSDEREELPEVGEESYTQGQQTFLEEQQTFYEAHSAQENEIVHKEANHPNEPDDKGKQKGREKPTDQRNLNAQEKPNVQEEHVAQGKEKVEEEHDIQGRPDHGKQKAQDSESRREHESLEKHRAQEKQQAQKEHNVQGGLRGRWKQKAQEEREGQEENSVKELHEGQIGYEAQGYNAQKEQNSQAMAKGQEEPEGLGEHGLQQEHDVQKKHRSREEKSRDTETDTTFVAEKQANGGEGCKRLGDKAAEEGRESKKEDRTPSDIEADGSRKANTGVGNDQLAALGEGTQKKKKKRARQKAKKEAAKLAAAEEASNEAGDKSNSLVQNQIETAQKEWSINDVEPEVVEEVVEGEVEGVVEGVVELEPENVLPMTKSRGEEEVATEDPATTSEGGAYSLKENDLDDPFFVAAVRPETSLPPRPPTRQQNEKPVPVGLPPKPQFTGLPIPKVNGPPLSPLPTSANPAPGSDLLSSLITGPPRPKRSVPPLMPHHQSFGAGQSLNKGLLGQPASRSHNLPGLDFGVTDTERDDAATSAGEANPTSSGLKPASGLSSQQGTPPASTSPSSLKPLFGVLPPQDAAAEGISSFASKKPSRIPRPQGALTAGMNPGGFPLSGSNTVQPGSLFFGNSPPSAPAFKNLPPGLFSDEVFKLPATSRPLPGFVPHNGLSAQQGSVFQNVPTLSGPFTGFGPNSSVTVNTPQSHQGIPFSNGAPPLAPSTLGMNKQSGVMPCGDALSKAVNSAVENKMEEMEPIADHGALKFKPHPMPK